MEAVETFDEPGVSVAATAIKIMDRLNTNPRSEYHRGGGIAFPKVLAELMSVLQSTTYM